MGKKKHYPQLKGSDKFNYRFGGVHAGNLFLPKKQAGGSIVDYLASRGVSSSFRDRKGLFNEYFDEHYKGTADQNTRLLDTLKAELNERTSAPPPPPQYALGPSPSPMMPGKAAKRTTPFLNASSLYTPLFRTDEERAAYQQRLTAESEKALEGGDDEEYLAFTPYHPKPDGYDCINGVCGLDLRAGLRYSNPTDADRYLSNTRFAKNIQEGKEDYYGVNGNFQVGDHFQYVSEEGNPTHSMKLYKVDKDESGKPLSYHFIHNGGGTTFKELEMAPDELEREMKPYAGMPRQMIAWRPGKTVDKEQLAKEHARGAFPYNAGEEQVEKYFGDTNLPSRFWLKPDDSDIGPDSPQYYFSGKNVEDGTKKELVSLMNDKDLDRKMREKLHITDETLQNLKPVVFGIAGAESNFDHTSAGRAIKEQVAEAVKSDPSVGLFQMRLGSVSDKAKKAFGISSADDLKDTKKAYIAAIDRMLEGKRVTDAMIEKGYHPELANANPYFRAAYYYNQPQRVLKSDEDYAREQGAAEESDDYQELLAKSRLRGDEGSYMHKVLQAAYPLGMEVLDDETPAELSRVEVVSKLRTKPRAPKLPAQDIPSSTYRPTSGRGYRRSTAREEKWGGNIDYQYGGISTQGYKANSPDRFNPFNIIPSNNITMKNVRHPVLGIDNTGATKLMHPGINYQFPGQSVFEIPMRGFGGNIGYYQQGGEARLVSVVPEGYAFTREQQGKKYYAKSGSSSLPTASATSAGKGGSEYEQFLINKLSAGVTPEELVQKKYISPSLLEKYRSYYKPQQDVVYTQPQPLPPPVNNPAQGFSGELIFDPQGHAVAQVRYPTRKSTGQSDPGTLPPPKEVEFMFVDQMGNPDLSRGYYVIPDSTYSNDMTGGVKMLRDTTGISGHRVPIPLQYGGNYMQLAGEYNPFNPLPAMPIGSVYDRFKPNPFPGLSPNRIPIGLKASMEDQMESMYDKFDPNAMSVTAPSVTNTQNQGRTLPIGSVYDRFKPNPFPGLSPIRIPIGPKASMENRMKSLYDKFDPNAVTNTQNQGRTYNLPGLKKTVRGPNVPAAAGTVAGMSFLGNALEAKDRNKYEEWKRLMGMSDSMGPVVPGSRGDYTMNEGYFRPDQHTPVQFGAIPYAQFGGHYDAPLELSPIGKTKKLLDSFNAVSAASAEPNVDREKPIPAPPPSMEERPNKASRKAYEYYVNEKNLEPHIAAGIIGNLFWESGLKTNVKERGHTEAGRGIAQWDVRDRWKGFINWAEKNKRDPYGLYTQLDYILAEPGESAKALKAMAKASTPEEAAYVFGKMYERPLDKKDLPHTENPARWDVRAGIARQLYNEFQQPDVMQLGGEATPVPSTLPIDSQTGAPVRYQQGGGVVDHYKKQMLEKEGKYLITDKGTNRTYYGYPGPNGKLIEDSFEVLTGKGNKNSYISPYTLAQMDEMSEKDRDNAKVTPIGVFPLEYEPKIYGNPGLRVQGTVGVVMHNTYDPAVRDKYYNNNNPADNYASYGCINCHRPDLNKVLQGFGNKDHISIVDSRRSIDENKTIGEENNYLQAHASAARMLFEKPGSRFVKRTWNPVKGVFEGEESDYDPRTETIISKKDLGNVTVTSHKPKTLLADVARQFSTGGDVDAGQGYNIRRTLQPVDRGQANIEAERGETISGDFDQDGMNEHLSVGGQRHSSGGTPLMVPAGSFVFSDTKKMKIGGDFLQEFGRSTSGKKKYTPAELAKQYEIEKYKAIILDPASDKMDKDTAKLMLENNQLKLSKLALLQEGMKGFPNGIPGIAMPLIQTALAMNPNMNAPMDDRTGQGQPPMDNRTGQGLFLQDPNGGVDPNQAPPPMEAGEMRYGGLIKAAAGYFDPEPIDPYKGDKNAPRQYQQKNLNLGKGFNKTDLSWLKDYGFENNPVGFEKALQGVGYKGDPSNNKDVQLFLVDENLKRGNVGLFNNMLTEWGVTNQGVGDGIAEEYGATGLKREDANNEKVKAELKKIYADGIFGVRSGLMLQSLLPPKKTGPYGPPARFPSKALDFNPLRPGEIKFTPPQVQRSEEEQLPWTRRHTPIHEWWTQDVLNTGQALINANNIQKIGPTVVPLPASVPRPTFYDRTRELAANQEQGASQNMYAAMYGNAQRQRAVGSNIQGQVGVQGAKVLGDEQDKNVGVANQFAGVTADILNKQALYNTGAKKGYIDELATAKQQFLNSKMLGNANVVANINTGITNSEETGWLNAMNEQYAIDPRNGNIIFKGGRPLSNTGNSGANVDDAAWYNYYYNQFKKANSGMSDEDAKAFATMQIQNRLRLNNNNNGAQAGGTGLANYMSLPIGQGGRGGRGS